MSDLIVKNFDSYKLFLNESNSLFDNSPMLIETDQQKIYDIQKKVYMDRNLAGLDTSDLRVGLLASDPYLGMLIRDAVKRNTGEVCLYNRVVTPGGVCVLPMLRGSIVLIRIFRHSIRDWSVEAIQGHIDSRRKDITDVVHDEVMEEIGARPYSLISLGRLYTSTPLSSENLHLFSCLIDEIGDVGYSEGIASAVVIPQDEILNSIKDGLIGDGPTISLIMRAFSMGMISL